MQKITPHLWFDSQAEAAANFYVSIFKGSKIGPMARYGEAGAKISGIEKGSVMTVAFELAGQPFMALNGGPCSDSTKLFRSWSPARPSRRLTIIGKGCPRAVTRRRSSVAGSKTSSDFHGRSFPQPWVIS